MNSERYHWDKISSYGAKYAILCPDQLSKNECIRLCFAREDAQKICDALNLLEFGSKVDTDSQD